MSILEQRLSLVTLGVSDLHRARAFYTGTLGWKPTGSNPNIVFFDLGGMLLALYPHGALADDMLATAEGELPPYRGMTLAYNTRSEAEVDAVFAKLRTAGVSIVKEPQRVFWGGYSGYFRDPDGHVWEVAHNPFWRVEADGRIRPGE